MTDHLHPDLRNQLANATRPGESQTDAVHRLLTVAVNPLTAMALRNTAMALQNTRPGISGQLLALADLADTIAPSE